MKQTNKQIAFQISKLQIDITKLIIKNNKNETTATTLERATLSKLKTMKMKKREKRKYEGKKNFSNRKLKDTMK